MSLDPTVPQGGPERLRSQELSLRRTLPPGQVAGYDAERLLGVGAYGEVWVAVERNTGRRVAIKYYSHRGGVDWSLLSREVEKLAFLFADRYVVQLVGVGWDAEPPYYIMEYIEQGSLARRIQQGPLPVDEAVDLFQDVAVGLAHAHGKGVLHCDLKPANVLLDQDCRPRLADFGQSRLSHEQSPALGTLFYMAPEQADLNAVPDARWDVYALGALLYCMLTGSPPHRTPEAVARLERADDLKQRLHVYRKHIVRAGSPREDPRLPPLDRPLAAILERCLAVDPERRFPTVQAVLNALAERRRWRARRPVVLLGAIGPAILLAIVVWFAWRGFGAALAQSDGALTDAAVRSNHFAAQYVARAAGGELERRFRAVEAVAASERFHEAVRTLLADEEFDALSRRLSTPDGDDEALDPLREQFRALPQRQVLQGHFASLVARALDPSDEVASWFFCDPRGMSTARVPESLTLGRNYAWRSFFHGGLEDEESSWRPPPGPTFERTHLSEVFLSQATYRWIVAISTPVFAEDGQWLGVVAMTLELGRFIELQGGENQFAVLVDFREGRKRGLILQHPLFDEQIEARGPLPGDFESYRLAEGELPDAPERQRNYRDPLAEAPEGRAFDRQWLAQMEPVRIRDRDSGWIVVVQEAYDSAIGRTLAELRRGLMQYGLAALGAIALVTAGLWGLALRFFRETSPARSPAGEEPPVESSLPNSFTPDSPTMTHASAPRRPGSSPSG